MSNSPPSLQPGPSVPSGPSVESAQPGLPGPPARAVCRCAYCRIHALFGPVMIITVGVLFLMAQYSRWSFGELWPFLLIVAGLLKVAEAMASREGHPAQ
jgi:cell wall-active antibiotic response 4TMS protein YvqF